MAIRDWPISRRQEGLCETSLVLVGQAKKHFICTTHLWIRKLN
jgi:hypothetical protein